MFQKRRSLNAMAIMAAKSARHVFKSSREGFGGDIRADIHPEKAMPLQWRRDIESLCRNMKG